jgi:hypothetical protein
MPGAGSAAIVRSGNEKNITRLDFESFQILLRPRNAAYL